METTTPLCLACNKPVKGRSDKKFCNDYCRNIFNNRLKNEENNYIRQITVTLKKNRRILEDLLRGDSMVKLSKDKLTNKGFHFSYHTHQYINQKGGIYYFCFEYGFLQLDANRYLIVKKKDIIKI